MKVEEKASGSTERKGFDGPLSPDLFPSHGRTGDEKVALMLRGKTAVKACTLGGSHSCTFASNSNMHLTR